MIPVPKTYQNRYYPGCGVLAAWMNRNGPDRRFGGGIIIHREFYRTVWKYESRFGQYPSEELWATILKQVTQKLKEQA